MKTTPPHYLRQVLDDAYAFMEKLATHPIRECGERMVCLHDLAAEAGIPIDLPGDLKLGRFGRVFMLRESLAPLLLGAADRFAHRGWLLRVEDAYRPPARQREGARSEYVLRQVCRVVAMETGGELPAELVYRRLCVYTAITPRQANHTSGSAVDITVYRRDTGREVDRGSPYPAFSTAMPMDSPFISETARRNRLACNDIMAEFGFVPYPYEFWHYSSGDADAHLLAGSRRPGRFGPVMLDERTGTVTPVDDYDELFISPEDVADSLRDTDWTDDLLNLPAPPPTT